MSVMNQEIVWLGWTGLHMTPWKLIGLTGSAMFGGRWLVQFVASRRARRPVIPRLFWYMSLAGSLMALSYFLFSSKQDAVGVLQNLLPAFTAASSLYLDIHHSRQQREAGTARCSPAVGRQPQQPPAAAFLQQPQRTVRYLLAIPDAPSHSVAPHLARPRAV